MKPFTYERPKSAAEAAASVARSGNAKFIAGGTNLLDLMKLQIETPNHLIDVNGLSLDRIEPMPDGGLRIGALVRNTDLAADPADSPGLCGACHARCWLAHQANCATRRPRPAISCSAPDAPIFTTPTNPATSGGPAVDARPLMASIGSTR